MSVRAGSQLGSILEINGFSFSSLAGGITIDNKGDMLLAQRADGEVFFTSNGKTKAVLNLSVAGSNGLIEMDASPKFNKDHQVYFYYDSAKRDGGAATGLKLGEYTWNASSHKLILEKTTNVKLPAGDTAPLGQIGFDSKFRASVTFPAKPKPPAVSPPPASPPPSSPLPSPPDTGQPVEAGGTLTIGNSFTGSFAGSFNFVTMADSPDIAGYHVMSADIATPVLPPATPSLTTTPTPEPTETALLISGLGALLSRRRRSRSRSIK